MARQPDDKAAAKFSSEDSALVRELALLLDETSLTEIEIERAGLRLRVARNISVAATMPMQMAAGPAVLPAAAAARPPARRGRGRPPGQPRRTLGSIRARFSRRWLAPPIGRRSPAPSRSSRSA